MKKHLKKVLYLITAGMLVFSCTKSEIIPTEVEKVIKKVVVKEVTKEIINEIEVEVIKEVPTDGETPEISMETISKEVVKAEGNEMLTEADDEVIDGEKKIFNPKYRSFYVNAMLSVKLQENGKYFIQNYLPHNFKNLKLVGKIKNVEMNPIVLVTFTNYPAFYEFERALPFNKKETFFNDTEGNLISGENFDKIPVGDWEIYFQTDDTIFNKMNSINFILHYRYGEYNGPNVRGSWRRPTFNEARAYTPIILNIAYLFSTDEFKNGILNYEHNFYDNKEKTPLDKERVYNSFVNKVDGQMRERRQAIGIIHSPANLGGLGGGESFGIRGEYLTNREGAYYNLEKSGYWHMYPMDTWFHEFSHVAGYGHNGNMTYPVKEDGTGVGSGDILNAFGFTPICMRLYRKMLENKELPFNEYPFDENFNPKNND